MGRERGDDRSGDEERKHRWEEGRWEGEVKWYEV